MTPNVGRSQNRIRGFASPEIEYQLLRPLGAAQYGGASVGETMYVTNSVSETDPDSWVARFVAMGDRTLALAVEARAHGHRVSACDHLLRASTYYRSAEYYADPLTNAREIGRKSQQAFADALSLMAHPAEALRIPYEDAWLPGYFMKPGDKAGRRKTVIMISGSDGTSEEIYFFMGVGALQRGYNVLLVDGPGQVGAFRFHPELHFRPDYEAPLGAAIDYAQGRPEVDSAKLALFGVSFGGYFVARTAACDRRVRAVISDSPLCNVGPVISALLGDVAAKLGHDVAIADIAQLPDAVLSSYAKRPLMSHAIRFGAASAAEFVDKANRFVLSADLLKNITCPSLVLGSSGEGEAFKAQCDFYVKAASGPVTRYEFTAEEGADAHCQMGNAQMLCARAYDWLDDLFKAA
jgi:pimeloyl-ACP methyl ester carboxylesterase